VILLYDPLDPEAVVRVLGFPEGDEGFELPVELDV
jgi:hypothetical protein